MTQYLALLRGINVGAANRIRMDALKLLFEQAGFSSVETFIQSGNVLFCSPEPENAVVLKAEQALLDNAGIRTNVILRSAEELARAVSQLPFSQEEIASAAARNQEGESLYLLFAAQAPQDASKFEQTGLLIEGDAFRLAGRDGYLLLSQSIRTSKLASRQQKALMPVTARNWNTVCQLLERMNARNQ